MGKYQAGSIGWLGLLAVLFFVSALAAIFWESYEKMQKRQLYATLCMHDENPSHCFETAQRLEEQQVLDRKLERQAERFQRREARKERRAEIKAMSWSEAFEQGEVSHKFLYSWLSLAVWVAVPPIILIILKRLFR